MIDTQDVCPSLVLLNLVHQQVDTARNQAIQLEKRAKNFDKVIAEWKQKLDELTAQLESSQKDYRWDSVFILKNLCALMPGNRLLGDKSGLGSEAVFTGKKTPRRMSTAFGW